MTTGPYETEAQARETAAVQEIHRAFRAEPAWGGWPAHQRHANARIRQEMAAGKASRLSCTCLAIIMNGKSGSCANDQGSVPPRANAA